ncbi:hypothetical protein BCV70DRAFT_205816 [Testicularia cyperi]|uniref:Uncharacterized protein n=1 Tax=Testicularia cyperi TaxID=1882483 RepID=A0A317XT11_9BASI|nr:hypothetical protein BCV70DRAFT_205816 [Testicularia cyperi]
MPDHRASSLPEALRSSIFAVYIGRRFGEHSEKKSRTEVLGWTPDASASVSVFGHRIRSETAKCCKTRPGESSQPHQCASSCLRCLCKPAEGRADRGEKAPELKRSSKELKEPALAELVGGAEAFQKLGSGELETEAATVCSSPRLHPVVLPVSATSLRTTCIQMADRSCSAELQGNGELKKSVQLYDIESTTKYPVRNSAGRSPT